MKNTEDIHQLIQALSKAEKRHFKMSAARYSKNQNNYLMLFDAIDQQEQYDESKLKQKFRQHAFGKSINKTKYLLYELILRSIRPLCNSKSILSQMESRIQSIDFLFSKGLYTQASTLLKKTKKLITEYQLYPLLLNILDWEKQLIHFEEQSVNLASVRSLLEEYDLVASQVRTEMRYRVVVEKLYHLSKVLPPEKCAEVLEEELDNLPVEDSPSVTTFLSKIYRGELLAQRAFDLGEIDRALQFQTKVYQLWQAQPFLRMVFPKDFQRNVQTYLFYLRNKPLTDESVYMDILQFLKDGLPNRTIEEEEKIDLQHYMLDFIINLTQGNLQICATHLMTIRDSIDRYEKLMDVSTQIQLFYHIGVYYFLTKDFREALEWIIIAQQKANRQLHPRSQRFCQLIELMARYELGEYEYLASAVRKMYRSLKQEHRVIKIESLVLKSVKQLLKVSHSSEVNYIFARLYNSLQQIDDPTYHCDNLQTNLLYQWIHEYLSPEKDENFN